MNPETYNLLISLGLDLGRILLGHFARTNAAGGNVPQEVLDAVGSAVSAIEAHSKDLMTSDQWDAAKAHVPAEGQDTITEILPPPAPAPTPTPEGGPTPQ